MVNPTGVQVTVWTTTALLPIEASRQQNGWAFSCGRLMIYRTTAQLAIESGDWNRELNLDRDLYGASPGTVMAVLGEQDDGYDTVCITSHEPTMSSFIYQYTDAGYLRFPTATMARIDFDINSWSALESSRGSLRWLTRPKELD